MSTRRSKRVAVQPKADYACNAFLYTINAATESAYLFTDDGSDMIAKPAPKKLTASRADFDAEFESDTEVPASAQGDSKPQHLLQDSEDLALVAAALKSTSTQSSDDSGVVNGVPTTASSTKKPTRVIPDSDDDEDVVHTPAQRWRQRGFVPDSDCDSDDDDAATNDDSRMLENFKLPRAAQALDSAKQVAILAYEKPKLAPREKMPASGPEKLKRKRSVRDVDDAMASAAKKSPEIFIEISDDDDCSRAPSKKHCIQKQSEISLASASSSKIPYGTPPTSYLSKSPYAAPSSVSSQKSSYSAMPTALSPEDRYATPATSTSLKDAYATPSTASSSERSCNSVLTASPSKGTSTSPTTAISSESFYIFCDPMSTAVSSMTYVIPSTGPLSKMSSNAMQTASLSKIPSATLSTASSSKTSSNTMQAALLSKSPQVTLSTSISSKNAEPPMLMTWPSTDAMDSEKVQLSHSTRNATASWVRAILPEDYIRAVICVGRKSRWVKKSIVRELIQRNLSLYQSFEDVIHERVHPNCANCSAVFHSVILNGVSSNENFATFNSNQDLKQLRNDLNGLQNDEGLVFIAIFGKDGLTTNTRGFREFFDSLTNTANIRLAVYLGNNELRIFSVTQLIDAIRSEETHTQGHLQLTEEQSLVGDWLAIMNNKEELARNIRDNKSIMPIQRNKTVISLEWDPKDVMEEIVSWTSENMQKRLSARARKEMERSGRQVLPYNLRLAEGSTNLQCIVEGCNRSVEDYDALVLHIYKHCVKSGERQCILCDKNRPMAYGRDVLFYKPDGPNQPTLYHLQRHLPPQIVCPDCPGRFCTKENLRRHAVMHGPGYIPKFRGNSNLLRKEIPCGWNCGEVFDSTNKREVHQDKTCPNRPHDVDRMHECPTCGQVFTTCRMMRDHEHAVHVRGAEVREILLEKGINLPRPLGSDLVRTKFQGASEDRENDRRGVGGLLGLYDREA